MKNPLKYPFLGAIHFYQRWISPLLGNNCRYYPSCSHYAKIAIKELPLYKAIPLTTWRIIRCNPYTKGGFDYVPGVAPEKQQPENDQKS